MKQTLREKIENYENPFIAERYFGHEKCYEEIEYFRKFVLKNMKKM